MRCLLVLVGLVLGVCLGELVLRALRIAPAIKSVDLDADDCVYQRSQNPILGFELKPNYASDNPDFVSTYERTNGFGFRDLPRKPHASADVTRILLVGDSVVEGYGLPFEQTLAVQIQNLFDQQKSSEQYEVLNFGVSAYCTRAEVELLEKRGLQFRPDYVVLVFVENDFDNFNREAFPLQSTYRRPAVARWAFEHSHLFRITGITLNLFQFRELADPARWNSHAIGENNVWAGLERLQQLAEAHRFQPIIAIWPRFEDEAVTDLHTMPGKSELIVEGLAAKYGIPCFRLSEHFRKDVLEKRVRSPRLAYSQGDKLHPSKYGNAIAAEAIYDAINNGVPDPAAQVASDDELMAAIMQTSTMNATNAHVYNRVGNQRLRNGDIDGAIAQYQLALTEDADLAATHCNLGIALQRKNTSVDRKKAEQSYRRAIELDPDFAEAHLNLATLFENNNDEVAQRHFIRAVEIKPDFVAAHFGLCGCLYRAERPRAAEAGLRHLLKLAPHHTRACLMLAAIHMKQKRWVAARESYEKVLQIEPEHTEALNNLAAVVLAMGDRELAVSYLRKAAASDPRAAQSLKSLLNSEESQLESKAIER